MNTKQKTTKQTSAKTIVSKLKDKSFQISITIDKETIQKQYQKILTNMANNINIDGFRKGKAPLHLIEEKIDLSKLYEQIIQNTVPDEYLKTIKKYNLKPITQPKILLKNPPLVKNKNWQLELRSCEKPEIILGNYQDEIKKINKQISAQSSKEKKQTPTKPQTSTQQHTQLIFNVLDKKSKLELPNILLEIETEHRLSQLVNNISQAGLTVKQYFENNNSSIENYKQNIKKDLIKKWKIDLALEKIAQKHNIKISKKELDKTIASTPEGEKRKDFIEYILTQQKTIEFLQTHNI
ncbi:hypothetical protein KKC08_01890 [Patescibacteria group bacterium]|nr:hypothetical protein [Patescibacteria group bacterium]MCG2702351.1 hypothetical protein [Candidatus Parcubacteria bacterium]MBU4264959.1 hypothetical protein [Patescibacteria group bacterium]MBU4389796.1 hypothetical protein [Patescibacteria group bacterium]MBU4396894.1 hypothetical protein [Patescibacteria group bacterium]